MFFILRSMQQRDLSNSHYLSVRWGLPYFCSSYFALLCPILKSLSEPAKGYGAWQQCQEGEGKWVKHFLDDDWHHNPKFHLQPSRVHLPVTCLPQSLPGDKSPFLVYFPCLCALLHSAVWTHSIWVPLSIPASHTFTLTFTPNGSKPNKIMPWGCQEATNLQLLLRQIFLDLKTSKFSHYLVEWSWAVSNFFLF